MIARKGVVIATVAIVTVYHPQPTQALCDAKICAKIHYSKELKFRVYFYKVTFVRYLSVENFLLRIAY